MSLCTVPPLSTYLNTSQHISKYLNISQISCQQVLSRVVHMSVCTVPPLSTYLNTSQQISPYLKYPANKFYLALSTCPCALCPLSTCRANSHFYLHHGRCQLRFCLQTSFSSGRHWWHSSYYNVWTISSIYQTSMDGTVFSISEALTLDHFQSSDMCFLPEMQIETVILILCIYAAESYRERKPIPGFQRLGRC